MQNVNPYEGRTVVLVDHQDNKLGLVDIWEAHKNPGLLHRAISVVLWRENDGHKEILLQRRSEMKPLWPLFWSNTVCTHPLDGEGYLECGVRRLREELGIKMIESDMVIVFRLKYQADYNEELSEHELDTIVIGNYEGEWECNPNEADDAEWMSINDVKSDIIKRPDSYTPWFKKLMANNDFLKKLD